MRDEETNVSGTYGNGHFLVTVEWLHRFATKGIGFTRQQFDILKVPRPPRAGWAKRLHGTHITHAQRDAFERAFEDRQATLDRKAAAREAQPPLTAHTPSNNPSKWAVWQEAPLAAGCPVCGAHVAPYNRPLHQHWHQQLERKISAS